MDVLLLHNEYGAVSGEEYALRSIADMLNENGCQVSWFLKSSSSIQGIGDKVRAFFNGIHSPGAVKELRSVLQHQHFDVAFVQNLYPLLSPSILPVLRKSGLPIIMRCPNYRLFCPNGLHLSKGEICERCLGGKEYWCLLRNCEDNLFKSFGYAVRNAAARMTGRILDNVTVFIVLSEFQRQRFIAEGIPEERIEILPNIAPTAPSSLPDEPGNLVSFVGRVSTEKGIDLFLKAAQALPDIPFAVAGSYDQMSDLPRRSPSNVRWLGFLDWPALYNLYQKSRILIFPSLWYEGFPNVIVGAMVLKKPVIASRLGALPEIIEDGHSGLLFEPGNVAGLVKCIRNLYNNPDLCRSLGAAGRIKAERQYSSTVVSSRLMEIFDKARQLHRSDSSVFGQA